MKLTKHCRWYTRQGATGLHYSHKTSRCDTRTDEAHLSTQGHSRLNTYANPRQMSFPCQIYQDLRDSACSVAPRLPVRLQAWEGPGKAVSVAGFAKEALDLPFVHVALDVQSNAFAVRVRLIKPIEQMPSHCLGVVTHALIDSHTTIRRAIRVFSRCLFSKWHQLRYELQREEDLGGRSVQLKPSKLDNNGIAHRGDARALPAICLQAGWRQFDKAMMRSDASPTTSLLPCSHSPSSAQ